jgi:hypothetical protein
MTRLRLIELLAAAAGIAGTVMLASRSQGAGFGFVAYLASNTGWLIFSWRHKHWPFFWQQVAFTLASLWGIWRWLLEPLAK